MYLIIAFIISLICSLIVHKYLIGFLSKLAFGQSIREEGPESHLEKTGTPTMGGIGFLSVFFILLLMSRQFSIEYYIIIIATFGLGIIGFIDDYIIVVTKNNAGLKPSYKIFGQVLVGVVVAFLSTQYIGSDLYVPFLDRYVNFGFLYFPLIIVFVVALSNAVNLTDGLDGLSTSVTIVVLIFFAIIGVISSMPIISRATVILIGALLGFLKYNWKPAKIFMGDVGSLALGGAVAAFAIVTKTVLLIPIVGVIYLIETLSVMIQVYYFKKTGKRIFLMAPIHHHFEKLGYSEKEIVVRFTIVTVAAVVVTLIIV